MEEDRTKRKHTRGNVEEGKKKREKEKLAEKQS